MAGTSYIYQFGEDCDPPYIQTDAEYLADAMRTDGWQPGVVRQEFLNKVDRQGNSIAAGLAAFMAAYESGTVDVKDDLSPTALSNILLDAISHAPLTTQAQFDNTQKVANTLFVNRALGSLSVDTGYGVDTALTTSNVGGVISPTAGGLTFVLPDQNSVRAGSKLYFVGNGHGCTINSHAAQSISNGTAGNISSVSLAGDDVLELTCITDVWTVTGGNEQLNTSSQFAGSLITDGWGLLPGGRIEQWGFASVNTSSAGPITTINLPTAWPNGLLNGQVTIGSITGSVSIPGSFVNFGITYNISNPLTQIDIKGYESITNSHSVFYKVIGH